MKMFKNFFLILFFLAVSVNYLKAQEKVSYIDIDYILASSVAAI